MIKLHVNSSLPRAGSEVFSVLVSQHPEIYASATSPLLEYFHGSRTNFTLPEVKSQNKELMQKAFLNFCREGANGYYSALTNRKVIIDKSRGFLEYAEFLWDIFPDAKIVCMTRKIDDIIASLERIYRKNVGHPETRHLPKTSEQRAKFWMSSGNLPLGLALDRFLDRRSRGEDKRILYIDYDDLVSHPVEVMKTAFVHYGVTPIIIDPMNVVKTVEEDDSHYGIFGKHSVRRVISKIKE